MSAEAIHQLHRMIGCGKVIGIVDGALVVRVATRTQQAYVDNLARSIHETTGKQVVAIVR